MEDNIEKNLQEVGYKNVTEFLWLRIGITGEFS
jgi:hypothetical protein